MYAFGKLATTVTALDGEYIEVSTMTMGTMFSDAPETCLFFKRKHDGRMSRVVETYSNTTEAIIGHDKWVDLVEREGVLA